MIDLTDIQMREDALSFIARINELEAENAALKLKLEFNEKGYALIHAQKDACDMRIEKLERIIVESQKPMLAKHQPCGCVICTCVNDYQCQGCGSRHCGTHEVGKIPNPIFESPVIPDLERKLLEARLENTAYLLSKCGEESRDVIGWLEHHAYELRAQLATLGE